MARSDLRHRPLMLRVLTGVALLPLLTPAVVAHPDPASANPGASMSTPGVGVATPGASVSSTGAGSATPATAAQDQNPVATSPSSKGAKGAQVYCYLRAGGNSHEVSWTAAYAVIKRQPSNSPFKPSPEHASVMITEAVIENPGAFPDCSRYLGTMFEKPGAPATTR